MWRGLWGRLLRKAGAKCNLLRLTLAWIDTVLACKPGCYGGTNFSVAKEIAIHIMLHFSGVTTVPGYARNGQARIHVYFANTLQALERKSLVLPRLPSLSIFPSNLPLSPEQVFICHQTFQTHWPTRMNLIRANPNLRTEPKTHAI